MAHPISYACEGAFLRIAILACHELKPEHFPGMKEALEAADKLIEHQRKDFPNIAESHPDIVVDGKLLDQFWYGKHQGAQGGSAPSLRNC